MPTEYRKITPAILKAMKESKEAKEAVKVVDAPIKKEHKKAQHTLTPKQWKHRKIRMKMAKQSRRRNMRYDRAR